MLLGTVALLLGAADVPASLEQFIPAGWKAGACPASYGRNSVLCAGTDTGPFKVDHHVPTVWIRTPGGGCTAAREASRRDSKQKGFTLVRETVGRCGSQAAPCVEHELRGRSSDAARVFEYVVCPADRDPLLVSYGVSSRVALAFHDTARRQVRWAEGQVPVVHTDPIQIGPEASLEGVPGDPTLNLVRSHRPEIERCRAEAIATGRVPIGKVVIKWQIGANGRVAAAETLSDDTKAPSLAVCLLARIRAWEFPPPKGGGVVFITCPFQFRAGD
ncbi:MAG TPA: AgmX/PglI C-terminal domain-containing protein [Myxococcaceae bacterium]|nr:AgmX/PglI C-terminal domain-containing protein [Myxococcaceae bacterium]